MALLKKFTFLYLRRAQSFCSQVIEPNMLELLSKKHGVKNKIQICKAMLYEDILDKPNLSDKEWEDIRKSLIKNLGAVTPSVADSLILDVCYNKRHINNGINYYKFLEKNNCKTSLITTVKFLKLYQFKTYEIPQTEKEHILKMYKAIIAEFPALDLFTANACVTSLCKIGEWRESMDIIKRFESYDKGYLLDAYGEIIKYFYTHGQAELGYKYLERSYQKGPGPASYVYETYLTYCLRDWETFTENIEKLFHLWMNYDYKPSLEIINYCIKTCNEVGLRAVLTSMSHLRCKACGHKISEVTLSDDEFKRLSDAIDQTWFVERINYVTSPEELKRFTQFIERRKPYDVVIDGLNILFHSSSMYNDLLGNIINHFNAKKQKVLIIGRVHLTRRKSIKYYMKKADFFFVNDMSKDDEFVVYAAIKSGINCKIVTQDFLRELTFNLKTHELRGLFKRWLLTHQETNIKDVLGQKEKHLIHNVNCSVQKHQEYWHIPYTVGIINTQRTNHTNPNQWACFKTCK